MVAYELVEFCLFKILFAMHTIKMNVWQVTMKVYEG